MCSKPLDHKDPGKIRGATVLGLAAIDEENFLVIENRAAKGWWLVHPAPPKTGARLSGRQRGRISPEESGKSREIEKASERHVGTFLVSVPAARVVPPAAGHRAAASLYESIKATRRLPTY
jgi:hypothetical protein